MYCLSDLEVDFILKDIIARGITTEDIQYNLLDHICIIIEQNLEQNGDFKEFYFSAIKTFYRHDLSEIETETRILSNYKKHLVLNRKQFFLLVFSTFIGPFIAYNILWIDTNWQSTRWDIPIEIWGNSVAYALWPSLIFLVIFLTPEKFDPLIPKKSTILLGMKPFIKIIPDF
jgi:hypothetical protein